MSVELLGLDTFLSFGTFGALLGAIAINLIPFLSPSNLVLAGFFVLMLPNYHPALIAIMVAIGASVAKLVHYEFSYFMGTMLSSKVKDKINPHGMKLLKEWGSLGAFIAAVSPIPDDPVILPMGLLRFNIIKFFLAYFTGKISISLIGAYTASQLSSLKIFDPKITIISIIALMFIIGFIMHTDMLNKKYTYLLSFTLNVKTRLRQILETIKGIT